jgi:hypothetical protein
MTNPFPGATVVTDFGAVADGGITDNTPKIMAAIAATPDHGALVFPPPGVVGGFYGFNSTIAQDVPISWFGLSAGTRLRPMPGFVGDNVHLQVRSYWKNVKFEGFTLGDDPNIGGQYVPVVVGFTRNGNKGFWLDCTSNGPGGVQFVTWERCCVGESGHGESVLVAGIATQHCGVIDSEVHGGVYFRGVADSCYISNKSRLGGNSAYARAHFSPAGGHCGMYDSTHVGAAGLEVLSGSGMGLINCFFEQNPNQASQYPRNCQIDIHAAVRNMHIRDCTLLVGGNSTNIINESPDLRIDGNFIGSVQGLQAIYNPAGAGIISGPNSWNTTPQKVGGAGTVRNLLGQIIPDAL